MTYRRLLTSLATVTIPIFLAVGVGGGIVAGLNAAVGGCSFNLAHAVTWPTTCYRSRIPAQLLDTAPFSVVDPREIVSAVTGLRLTAIYVAQLGSDDPNNAHPRGPLMEAYYLFGSPPASSGGSRAHRSYLAVQEDMYAPPGRGGVFTGGGTVSDRIFFERHRLAVGVTTDGPRSWAVTTTRKITGIVRKLPVRPLPPLRLYVRAPPTTVQVGAPATFYMLNNTRAACKPADFYLVLKGRWSSPSIFLPYEGGACGGDNIPVLKRRSRSRWHIDFGDCDEVGITATPRQPGSYWLAIRTYRLVWGANGMPVPGRRYPAPHAGFQWSGQAS